MKKILITVRNIILGVLLIVYLSFTILVSTLLLNRNDYGVTQFNDKALILVDEQISNEKYKKGSLVIVEKKELSELKIGEEIFIYQTNKKDKSVQIIISEVGKVKLDVTSPYVVLKNEGTAWGEEFVAGTHHKTYENIGALLSFIQSKWVFFILLIVPCFFILLYEIHLVIVTIKFGDLEEDEEEDKNYKNELESKNEEIEELMKQIKELKKENEEKEKTPKKKDTANKEIKEPTKKKEEKTKE